MSSLRSVWLISLFALPTLLLAGCGSGTSSNSSTPPPPTSYQLTVAPPPTGAGTITSNPSGITCPSTCTAGFAANTKVTLTAAPSGTYTFAGFTGACSGMTCTVTMTAAESVTDSFDAVSGQQLTVALSGPGTGTVTSSPAAINCSVSSPSLCSATFPKNTVVTLSETPVATNTFAGWSGGCTGTTPCSVTLSAASSVTATFGGSLQTNINHIILFVQENRSLDHYFGAMLPYWASIGLHQTDGVTFDGLPQFNPGGVAPSVPGCQLSTDADSCTPDPTNPITSFHFASVCEENQSPFWNEARNDWSLADPADQTGKPAALDGFVYTSAYDARSNGFMDVNGVRGMGYYTNTDLNFYYFMASQFGTSDRWFSPLMDRTQINRMYILAATSAGHAYPLAPPYNPLSNTTILQALQSKGISWKVYVDPANAVSPVTGENCETASPGQDQDTCLAGVSYINMFTYESQIQDASTGLWQHFAPIAQLNADMGADATFPQFALIEPASAAGLDEHPSDADDSPVNVQLGATYAENKVINFFIQSNIWNDSAMIFTYDEAGGLYDHVAPQPAIAPDSDTTPIDLVSGDICDKPGETLGQGNCNFAWTGYRVPMIVISPYSVKNFVSHTVRDTTAVLKMVETRFLADVNGNVPSLTARDASQPDMNEFFDFVNKPWATPPTPPAQSTSGTCDQTPLASWNEPPELTVTVTGSGNVTSSPASAINSCTTECTGVFSTGTIVTLTATPASGSTFTGWGGACTGTAACAVASTGHAAVTATFTP